MTTKTTKTPKRSTKRPSAEQTDATQTAPRPSAAQGADTTEPPRNRALQLNLAVTPELRAELDACGADEAFHGGAPATAHLVVRKAIGCYLKIWREDRAERHRAQLQPR